MHNKCITLCPMTGAEPDSDDENFFGMEKYKMLLKSYDIKYIKQHHKYI